MRLKRVDTDVLYAMTLRIEFKSLRHLKS